jgi:hypothetical protein
VTSFRSFLARERLVPVEQLDRALQRQILYGEDLSVNLLEMGAVDEDLLAQFLGMFHRLPIVTRADLRSVSAAIIAQVPAQLAVRHRICPVALADEMMVVAATKQLERSVIVELERTTGKHVSLVIGSPVTLAWGLAQHYGAEMPARYQRILEHEPRKRESLPPAPGPEIGAPGAAEAQPEEPARPRRSSGIIVMPGDVPESELASMTEPADVPSTPEASIVPPAPSRALPTAPPALPLKAEFEAAAVASAAEEVLKGVSLSHDNPADRLLEMVLGPPTDSGRPPTVPPPRPSQPPAVADGAPGAGPADRPPSTVPPPVSPIAGHEEGQPGAPFATPAEHGPIRFGASASPAEAVVRVRAVVLSVADEVERRAPPIAAPSAVEALLGVPGAGPAVAAPPRTALISRIARLDTLGTPSEVLRYAFQLFSAPFRVGILFDTTTPQPQLRDAFGVRTGAQSYRGRTLAVATIPTTVRNASQPILARVEVDGPLAELLAELFGDLPYNALFLPVTVGSRVVAVMYGDNREQATAFENVRELFHLAWAAGTRLAELVRKRRRVPLDSSSGSLPGTEPGVPPAPLPSE